VHDREGLARSFLTHKFPIVDEDGKVRAYGGISTDISDRRKDAEALRSSRERFEKVFRASTMSISITSLESGKFVDVNEACEVLTGYRRDEMVGRTGTELGFWHVAGDRRRAAEELRRSGSVREFETQLRDRKGGVHDVLMT